METEEGKEKEKLTHLSDKFKWLMFCKLWLNSEKSRRRNQNSNYIPDFFCMPEILKSLVFPLLRMLVINEGLKR